MPKRPAKQTEWEIEDDFDDAEPDRRMRRPRPLRCDILHQDAVLFVINKPAGVSFESNPFDTPNVVDQLTAETDADEDALLPVYPLEHDVSGLMVIARDPAAQEALTAQFADERMTLTCLAIARGMMLAEAGTMDQSVSHPRSGRVKVVAQHGETARTEWRVLDSFIGFVLLEVIPRTINDQQIRAHLHDAGTPLAVDTLHGGAEHLMLSSFKAGYRKSRRHEERPLIQRPSLHAWKVTFMHPQSGEPMSFEVPPPRDFKATLNQLQRFARIAK